ncbi:17491_t:CDS:2 [Rhizophagus irregularis]|nr:17491_t:CDS:2 [Rhizophagus irregularis]
MGHLCAELPVDSNRKWAKELRKKEKLNKAPVPQTPPKPKVILPEVTTLLLIQHHLSTAAQRNSRSSRTFFLTVLSLAVQEKLYIK